MESDLFDFKFISIKIKFIIRFHEAYKYALKTFNLIIYNLLAIICINYRKYILI